MSRQPIITELQGLDAVASPVATPVDAYSGAPAIASRTSSQELADALNTVSVSGMKSAEKAALERIKMEEEAAARLVADFQPEDETDEFGYNTKELQEQFPFLKPSTLGSLVEKRATRDTKNELLTKLMELPDSIRYDSVLTENVINEYTKEQKLKAGGKPFVLGGIVEGVIQARSQFESQTLEQRRQFVEKGFKKETLDFLDDTFKKVDFNNPESLQTAINLITQEDTKFKGDEKQNIPGTSPYSHKDAQAQLKEIWTQSFIATALKNPMIGSQILDAYSQLPWAGDKRSKRLISEARGDVAVKADAAFKVKQNREDYEFEQFSAKARIEVGNLQAKGDVDGLERLTTTPYTGDPTNTVAMRQHTFSQQLAQTALQNIYINPAKQAGTIDTYIDNLMAKASVGDVDEVAQREVISNLKISEDKKAELVTNLDTYLDGSELVRTESYNTKFGQLYGHLKGAENTTTHSLYGVNINIQNSIGKGILQLAKDHFSNEVIEEVKLFIKENGEVPRGTQMQPIYSTAREATDNYVERLRNSYNDAGGKPNVADNPTVPKIGEPMYDNDGVAIARVTGIGPDGLPTYEPIDPATDPRYIVTSQGDSDANPRAKAVSDRKNTDAIERLGNIFDEESAQFNLDADTLSRIDKLVQGRFQRASVKKRGGQQAAAVSEGAIMDIVLDQLDLDGVSDFEYGGFFGADKADTAGEIAIKKIVDSMMEKYKGE